MSEINHVSSSVPLGLKLHLPVRALTRWQTFSTNRPN